MTRTIDGRKATVINVGQAYTSFDDFAKRNGYPEAVDGKTRIKNGEVVTLLTSQTHGPHSSTVLWIVENAVGERQVIGEDGLDIHETQYTEVKRKAAVGERIKITAEISEEAAVGYYRTGDVMTVTEANRWQDGSGIGVKETHWGVFHSEYIVLQPILALKSSETVSIQATVTVSIADFQALQRKVDAMETSMKRMDTQLRVAREDIVLVEEGVSDDIRRLEAAVFTPKEAPETSVPSLTRQDVIDRAKEDVESLKVTHHPTLQRYYVVRCLTRQPECDAEFIVNRKKRTVVCLLRNRYGNRDVRTHGKSRCAPDDVFNVHIGRAIALRRALGLDVPDEYVHAPRPTVLKAGSIVSTHRHPDGYTLTMDWSYEEILRQHDVYRIIEEAS